MNIFAHSEVNEQGLRSNLKKQSVDSGKPVWSLSLYSRQSTKLFDLNDEKKEK